MLCAVDAAQPLALPDKIEDFDGASRSSSTPVTP